MRKTEALTLLAMVAFTACSDTAKDPTAVTSPRYDISDATHTNGNPHFFFLPPTAHPAAPNGDFDATQQPVVEICHVRPDGGCNAAFETYDMSSGVTVDEADEQYQLVWHVTPNLNPAATYRIRVLVDGIEVGHADVKAGYRASDLKGIDKDAYVTVLMSQTLPIKFRIEKDLISCTPQSGISGNNLQLELGAGVIPYNETTFNAGVYKNVPVLFAGGLVYGTNSDDYVLGNNTATSETDFDTTVPICVLRTPTLVYSRAEPVVTRAGTPSVHVVQESWAFQNAPDDDYAIVRYTFKNTASTTLSGLRAGLIFDWDVYFNGSAVNDFVRFLSDLNAGYIGESSDAVGMAGVASNENMTSYTGFKNGNELPVATSRELVCGRHQYDRHRAGRCQADRQCRSGGSGAGRIAQLHVCDFRR